MDDETYNALKAVIDDVRATADQALMNFAELEKTFMKRHQGRQNVDVSHMSLLLREIVSAMHVRILSICRDRVGDNYADIAEELAAKAIVVPRNVNKDDVGRG
jgi:hypothetical protein